MVMNKITRFGCMFKGNIYQNFVFNLATSKTTRLASNTIPLSKFVLQLVVVNRYGHKGNDLMKFEHTVYYYIEYGCDEDADVSYHHPQRIATDGQRIGRDDGGYDYNDASYHHHYRSCGTVL